MKPQLATQAELQELRRLSRRRSSRSAAGEFLVDGPVLVAEALASPLTVRTVFVDESNIADERIGPVVERAHQLGVTTKTVPTGRLKKTLDLPAPQPMVATVAIPTIDPSAAITAALANNRPMLGLIEVQDPGNVGTMIRIAEAAGYSLVFVSEGSVDIFNPKTVRATAGALFRMPVVTGTSIDDFLAQVQQHGLAIHSTIIHAGRSPEDLPLSETHLILIGSEAHGLPEDLANFEPVSIPMEGNVESLNAAVAAAVICFESARQRRHRISNSTRDQESEPQ